jgi:hypothetical protein
MRCDETRGRTKALSAPQLPAALVVLQMLVHALSFLVITFSIHAAGHVMHEMWVTSQRARGGQRVAPSTSCKHINVMWPCALQGAVPMPDPGANGVQRRGLRKGARGTLTPSVAATNCDGGGLDTSASPSAASLCAHLGLAATTPCTRGAMPRTATRSAHRGPITTASTPCACTSNLSLDSRQCILMPKSTNVRRGYNALCCGQYVWHALTWRLAHTAVRRPLREWHLLLLFFLHHPHNFRVEHEEQFAS